MDEHGRPISDWLRDLMARRVSNPAVGPEGVRMLTLMG